jgi:hypothetical protein
MRTQIELIENKYLTLKNSTIGLLKECGDERLHGVRSPDGKSVGELVIRSAAAVEQVIGGITRRLWDDPFEWTLTERMQTVDLIVAYIEEVETSRMKGFMFLKDDVDLTKELPAPIEMKSLCDVLNDAFLRAESHLNQAQTLLASQTD